jgi:hypothetical protein
VAFDEATEPEGLNALEEIMTSIQRQAGLQLRFSDAEVRAALEFLESENICMLTDDMITLV